MKANTTEISLPTSPVHGEFVCGGFLFGPAEKPEWKPFVIGFDEKGFTLGRCTWGGGPTLELETTAEEVPPLRSPLW